MTAEAKHFLEEFQTLPEDAKREVLTKILIMSRDIELPELTDDERIAIADEVFAAYDAEEDAD